MSAEHALLDKLRASAETLLAAKRAAKPSSKSQEVLLGESSAVLMELRGVVAGTLAAHASGEEAVERAKRRLTEADDELRALKYQRGRLQRAISECAEPPASTADAVATEAVLSDVISLEAAVSARRLQQPGAAPPPDVAHQQTLYRLGVERDERVRLHALRDGLVARKASLASAEEKASELKAAVDAQMETVTAAAAALQAELLPMPRSAEPFHPLAPLLPSPLYTLAMTAAAYLRAFEADATLSIVGDVEHGEKAPTAVAFATTAATDFAPTAATDSAPTAATASAPAAATASAPASADDVDGARPRHRRASSDASMALLRTLGAAADASSWKADWPPIVLLHGTADQTVPWEQSHDFAMRLRACGAYSVTERYYENKSHTDPIVEDPLCGGDVLLADLLDMVLGPADRTAELKAGLWPSMLPAPRWLFPLAKRINPF